MRHLLMNASSEGDAALRQTTAHIFTTSTHLSSREWPLKRKLSKKYTGKYTDIFSVTGKSVSFTCLIVLRGIKCECILDEKKFDDKEDEKIVGGSILFFYSMPLC